MMFTRVSLLFVVTGLFAAMWSADSPDTRSPGDRQLARRTSSFRLTDRLGTRKPERTASAAPQSGPDDVPLPRGIAPGTYLIVDHLGRTCQRTVDSHSGTDNFAPVDHYTLRGNGGRWHFIRLEEPAAQVLARPNSRHAQVQR